MFIRQVQLITGAMGWIMPALVFGLIVSGCATSEKSDTLSDHEKAIQRRAERMSDRI